MVNNYILRRVSGKCLRLKGASVKDALSSIGFKYDEINSCTESFHFISSGTTLLTIEKL